MYIGNLKSHHSLWMALAQHQRYKSYVTRADFDTFDTRLTNEGITFLTTVLPRLGKALDAFHATGVWKEPAGFSSRSQSFGAQWAFNVPLFLGSAIERALVGDSSAVDCVRQLSYAFYKLEVPHASETEAEFLDQFERTDKEITACLDSVDSDSYLSALLGHMRSIIARVLSNSDPLDIVPCHSGGATACRTKNKDKYYKLRYYSDLDNVYPYSDFFFFSTTHLVDKLDVLERSEDRGTPQARVCLVPKDSRGPRIISCEPAELMYIQQGLMRRLYKTIETHDLTQGMINFVDQSVNRELAKSASVDGALATLDLKDASDRVSLKLVELVFPPTWVRCLKASRSHRTELPNGRIVELNKFAPMGSACCFPVEALVFWACAQAGLRMQFGSRDAIYPVYVYGDDIITPTDFSERVIRSLESVGLLVNRDKCFVRGPFRESCGGDYHRGFDVTPVKIRKVPGTSGTTLVDSGDLGNEFIAKFGYESSQELLALIEELTGYSFPRSENLLPACFHAPYRVLNDVFFRRKWNNDFQRFEHRVLQPYTVVKQVRPPSWEELLRKQLRKHHEQGTSEPYVNPFTKMESTMDPGEYAVDHSVRMKWSWVWLGEPGPDQN